MLKQLAASIALTLTIASPSIAQPTPTLKQQAKVWCEATQQQLSKGLASQFDIAANRREPEERRQKAVQNVYIGMLTYFGPCQRHYQKFMKSLDAIAPKYPIEVKAVKDKMLELERKHRF